MRIGDFVTIKSIAQIKAEGRLDATHRYPAYATSEMLDYYGNEQVYPIVNIRRTSSRNYGPTGLAYYVKFNDFRTYSFAEEDLILNEELTSLTRNIVFTEGHRYKLVEDERLKHLFNLYLYDWDGLKGAEVDFYGDDACDGNISYVYVDTADGRYTHLAVPTFLIASHVGIIPGYDTSMKRYSCNRCGNTYRENEEEHNQLFMEDECLCPKCRLRNYVTPYHRYAPHLEFRNTDHDENSELYFGVELEVGRGGELDSNAEQVMNILNKDEKFIYCSHDSSINNGFEIITYPCTYEYHKAMMDKYQEAFDWMAHHGYRSHDERTCGLHIHFSRAYYFNDSQEKYTSRLIFLIQKFWDEIVLFSRKDMPSIDRYARAIDETPNDFYDRWNCTGDHDGHYFALNLVNSETIEFRIFRGTLNLKTYMLTLTLVRNMVIGAKKYNMNQLKNMVFEDFLDADGKEYFELRKRMKGFGATECSEEVN